MPLSSSSSRPSPHRSCHHRPSAALRCLLPERAGRCNHMCCHQDGACTSPFHHYHCMRVAARPRVPAAARLPSQIAPGRPCHGRGGGHGCSGRCRMEWASSRRAVVLGLGGTWPQLRPAGSVRILRPQCVGRALARHRPPWPGCLLWPPRIVHPALPALARSAGCPSWPPCR